MCKYCKFSKTANDRMTTLRGLNEWNKDFSIVEEEPDKCVVKIPRWLDSDDSDYIFDDGLGLIAVLLLKKLVVLHVKKTSELDFEFDINDVKKIRSVEKAYFSGKISVDAKQMSKALLIVVNHLWKER